MNESVLDRYVRQRMRKCKACSLQRDRDRRAARRMAGETA